MTDLEAQPVLFIPDVHFGNLQRAGQVRLPLNQNLVTCVPKDEPVFLKLSWIYVLLCVQVFTFNTEEIEREGWAIGNRKWVFHYSTSYKYKAPHTNIQPQPHDANKRHMFVCFVFSGACWWRGCSGHPMKICVRRLTNRSKRRRTRGVRAGCSLFSSTSGLCYRFSFDNPLL